VFGGSSGEPDAVLVERLRRRFDVATDAFRPVQPRSPVLALTPAALLVYRIICVDEDTTLWPAEDLGNLRVALNGLVRVFRLDR